MPTYVYETIPRNPDEAPERFELLQSMRDAPLEEHPETGAPVKRVITGGFGYMKHSSGAPAPSPAPSGRGGCCGGACGCH